MISVRAAVFASLALVAGCGGPRTPERIVLVTIDTTRADHLGCYGSSEAQTPNLDRLAAASVLFENAVSPVPTTLPAHSTIFTGLYPQDHGVRYNLFYKLPPEAQTLAESLKSAGFATAAFPASAILAASYGLDQGFDTYVEPPKRPDPEADNPIASADRSAADQIELARKWLDEHPDGKSFVWVHLYDAHWPYAPPFPYSAKFRDRPYEGEIAYMDGEFGRLLESLERSPAWDRTMLIVAGDHGEGLYDHAERWHTLLLYETTQHVPLIIRAPGARPARVASTVGLADLMPTVLDLLGLPIPPDTRGISLRPALEGRPLHGGGIYFETLAGALVYGWQELHGLRDGQWKLIDSDDPELYDMSADPAEEQNLAAAKPELLEELRVELRRLREPVSGTMAQKAAAAASVDQETEEMIRSLGYVGGGGGSAAEGAPHARELIYLEPELLAGQGLVAQQRWKEVEDLCRYTLERDRTNKWALINMAGALLARHEVDRALEHAEVAVKLYPDTEVSHQMLAVAHNAKGQPDQALRVLRAGLEVIPGSEVLRYLLLVAAFDNKLEEVCPKLVPEALTALPTSGRIRVLEARCQAEHGQPEQALETLRVAANSGFPWLKQLERAEPFAEVTKLPGFQGLLDEQEKKRKDEQRAGHSR